MGHNHNSTKNIKTAFFLNLSFTLLELVGGFLTNSVAIISDALHDLGDSLSLGLAWFLENYSKKGRDSKFTYGYGRFSLLGAWVNAMVLLIGSIFVLATAIPRLFKPEEPSAEGMILFAIVGIIVNGAAVLKLKNDESLNSKVIALHLLEDVMGWTAILGVAITLLFYDLYILDPILSVLITLYILFNVFKNLKKTVALFLQGTPEHIDIDVVDSKLRSIKKVMTSHHTHIWSLDGSKHILSTHLIIEKDTSRTEIVKIKKECKNIFNELKLSHITIDIEFEDEICLIDEDLH